MNTSLHPDIIFAEAVGSCTDLVATIIIPMLRFEPGIEIQLSVFADGPVLLSSLEGRSSFISDNIQYIYKKQLEEATILIVNKADLLTPDEVSTIQAMLTSQYPEKTVRFQDATNEISIKQWLRSMNETNPDRKFRSLDIDYKKYGAGEAALAWLDASVTIYSKGKAIEKSITFINEIIDEISLKKFAIGHLKFFLESGDWQQRISFTKPTESDPTNGIVHIKKDRVSVLVNARVEAKPDQLRQIFFRAIKKIEAENCYVEVGELDSFQPGYPKPTYRFAD